MSTLWMWCNHQFEGLTAKQTNADVISETEKWSIYWGNQLELLSTEIYIRLLYLSVERIFWTHSLVFQIPWGKKFVTYSASCVHTIRTLSAVIVSHLKVIMYKYFGNKGTQLRLALLQHIWFNIQNDDLKQIHNTKFCANSGRLYDAV